MDKERDTKGGKKESKNIREKTARKREERGKRSTRSEERKGKKSQRTGNR
jgi:hypothetical protein